MTRQAFNRQALLAIALVAMGNDDATEIKPRREPDFTDIRMLPFKVKRHTIENGHPLNPKRRKTKRKKK